MRTIQRLVPLVLILCSCVSIVITDGDDGAASEARTSSEGEGCTGIGGTGQQSDGATTSTSTSITATGVDGTSTSGETTSTGTGTGSGSTGGICDPTDLYEAHYPCADECQGACVDGESFCVTVDGTDLSTCSQTCKTMVDCTPPPFPPLWYEAVCLDHRCMIPCVQGMCPTTYECFGEGPGQVCLPTAQSAGA